VRGTVRLALLISCAVALAGCQRKAPGPRECHEFALRATGVSSEALVRADPRLRLVVDELTLRCLTTPYDRELLACAGGPADLRACFAAFQARHPERAARALPKR